MLGRPQDFEHISSVVDLGANVGVFTIYYLSVNPEGIAWSIETQPALIDSLRRNLLANGMQGRCHVINAFVGAATTDWAIEFCKNNPEVPSLDIVGLMDKAASVDFLKCDIEGSEHSLFANQPAWLGHVRRIVAEYHWTKKDGESLAESLNGAGFRTHMEGHGALGYVIADRSLS